MSEQPNLNYQSDISGTQFSNLIVKDVALKALLFSMVFYIINSNLMNKLLQCLDRFPYIDKNVIQSIVFGLVFYFISVNL